MKKLVRVLSVVMLIAMMMSIMNITAFAEVFDENGNAVSGNNNDGVLVVSADPNADLKKSEAAQQVSSDVLTDEEAEEVPVEAGSTYSILSTSANALDYFSSEEMLEENPIIYYNAKYIVYIREHMDELKATNPEVVDTAYALFGEKYMDMTFGTTTKVVSKSVALKSQIDSLSAVIEKLEALSADPSDPDAILAMRKAANAYRDTFQGVANYDFTDETSGFGSLDAALEAAKAELANVKAELDNLGNEEKKEEKKEEVKESEEEEEVIETPVPTTTPTPNEAIVETVVEDNVVDAAGEGAGLFNPIRFFKLFATPLTSISDIAGKTTNQSNSIPITGLAGWPIIVTLDNAVINMTSDDYAFVINDSNTICTIEACTINGNGVKVENGSVTLKYVHINDSKNKNAAVSVKKGTLEIGNCEINSSNDTAVKVEGSGYAYINGYNKIGTSASKFAAVVVDGTKEAKLVVDDTETTQSLISGFDYAGLEVKGGTATLKGQAKVSGKDGVIVTGGSFMMQDSARVDGIGKFRSDSPVGAAVEVTAGHAYIADGSLYSEYGYAVYTGGDPAHPELCFVANDKKVIETSKYDCKNPAQYSTGLITVNDTPYDTVNNANIAITDVPSGEKVNVVLLGDVTDTEKVGLVIDRPGDISIVGNGHTLKSNTSDYGIAISNGNVNISNITVEAANALGVGNPVATKTPNVNLNSSVILKASNTAITANDYGNVSVNDAILYGNQAFAISGNEKVVVNSCKDNCKDPIGTVNPKANLVLLGGYYLYNTGVEEYVPEGIAFLSSVTDSDGYYVVSMEEKPTVTIVNGAHGYDSKGLPYVVYDKANPKYITFEVDQKINRIDAVPVNGGTSVNIFNNTANGGIKGEIVIDIDAFQMNIDSGVYDLQFQFKNGYVMTQKVHLEVLPELTRLMAKSDYSDASPNGKGIDTAVNSYQVGAKQYIYAEVSELPTRIGVSADPNGNETTWFGYYNAAEDGDGVRVLKKDNKHYYILVDYAFLDQLAAGQDYIFLDYNGAMKRLDLKITNPNVSVEPTYLNYWGTDGNAVFTVKPDFKDVYIDGELVPTQFIKYDTDTKKLSINGEYLNQLNKGDHLVEIETSKGWLSATVHTGVALRPIDVDYHVYGGAKALAFQASDVIDTSAGIWIGKNNPVQIPADMIYFYDNNTKFTVSPSYLNRLALGTYYISAYVWNGEDYEYTSTTFRIVSASSAAYNPNTGDTFNPVVWIVIAVLAAVIVVVFLVPALKKKGGADVAKAAEEEIKEAKKKD